MSSPESYYFGALKRALEGDLEGAFSLQEKAKEAREAFGYSFSESIIEDFPFVEEAVTTLLSSYDFTRCVRPNGTAYGTRGKCRKGSEQVKADIPTAHKESLLEINRIHGRRDRKAAAPLERKILQTEKQMMSDQNLKVAKKVLAIAKSIHGKRKELLDALEKKGETGDRIEELRKQVEFHAKRMKQARDVLAHYKFG